MSRSCGISPKAVSQSAKMRRRKTRSRKHSRSIRRRTFFVSCAGRSRCAFVHAALGNRDAAIREGEAAVAMLPIERDFYDGPMLATNLAAVYAQLGEKERALDLLGKLRGRPMAATPGTLRVEPEWDALRDDPRFTSLLS